MSIILFFAVLFVLVLVHEWGHFIAARKTGMRVDEFAIGFPPKLFGIKRGETTYNFNLLPIGGYVKIYGENAEEDTSVDAARSFGARPKWAQAVVLLAGITMNILFAWFLFVLVLIIGVPSVVEESEATENARLVVASTLEGAPAYEALPVGAVITRVEGPQGATLEDPTPTSFIEFVGQVAPEPLSVTYEVADEEKTVSLRPQAGLITEDPQRYIVGASLSFVDTRKAPIFSAIVEGFGMTANGLVNITVGLATLLKEAVLGSADFSHIAGPVGIVGMVGDAASFGVTSLLLFTAVISLNLAVVNLLPFPALDGGRLVFVGIEAITRKKVPAHWMGWTNAVGFIILMLLMVAVTYNDILRLL